MKRKDMCRVTASLIKKGRVEESDRVSKLYLYLMNNGQTEEMKKAMENADYRNQLLSTLNM